MTETKTIKENYDNLKACMEGLGLDFEKFNNKKIKASGQRVRNNLLNSKKLCDIIRKQIMEEIREIPIKHRTNKDGKPVVNQEEGEAPKLTPTPKPEPEEPPKKKERKPRQANKPKKSKTPAPTPILSAETPLTQPTPI